jgi:glycosyltransferase involved in cell wall biosynthesis
MSSQAAEHRNSAFSNRVRGEEVRPPGLLTRPIPLRYIVLCALIFHVPLLMMRLPQNTYDANFHMSMASTYARHWFNPWNEKQLGGFSQTTYPPLTHQWIALLSHFVGLTNAYMIVQGAVILLLPLAVLRFCRLWVDERSASYAAFCSAFIGSLCILVYQDGQIGTTSSTTLFLLALPSLYAFILHGRRSDFTFGVVLACTAAAAHHATLIFGTVFFTAPLVWRAFIEYRERNPGKSLIEPTRRLGIALAMASLGIALVLLPYFISLLKNPIKQTPIPHQSRANFLLQPFWGVHYWVIPFGVFILALPYIFFKGAQRRYLPLFLGFYFAFLFGLGGTTPVPRWILGRAFAVLTFERFTFWALLLALPFAGMLISGLLDRFGTKAAVLVSLLLFSNAALAVATDVFFPLRGPALDVSSVIQFLNSNGHDRYRYLTLGFGSAISKIDCYTNAPTVDGEYNSARTLPEMTQHGAAEFTSAKYFGRAGIASLTAMLRHANHYGLKYIFSRDVYYEPLLTFAGWKKIADLDGGQIQVWTTIGIKPAGRIPSPYETSVWQGIIWGTVPFGFSVLAILMGIHRAYGGSESHRHTGIDEVRISSAPPAEAEGLIKRVALVTAFPPGRGDLSEYGFQLARVLKDSFGLTPLIYADLHSGVDHHPDDELPGYNVTRCWRFNSVASFVTLLSKIRKHRPDVVWFNIGLSTMANQPMPAMAASALPCLCRVLGYNTHVTLHAFSENVDFEHAAVSSPALYRFGARLATRLLLRSDGVHLMLPSYREQMLKTFGSRRQNIFVHPHGIFGYGPEDETPAQRTPGAVLAFGSWGTYKRLECLMEALPTIRRSLPAAQLWVAGGDHPKARRYLQDCAARYRDVPGVHFLGYVAEEHVAGLFRRASVAVLPYNSSAGSSGVVHLACEHQVPIVAADIPDLRELAEFENLHLAFFPANDPKALASELLRVLADDSIGKSLTEHNLRSVSKLTLREIVADYLRTFAHTASRGLSSHDRVQTENTHSEVAASGL